MGFIRRSGEAIEALPKGLEFVLNPDQRPVLFGEGALNIEAFSAFVDLLRSHSSRRESLLHLGIELKEKLGIDWKDSTAEVNAKIFLNWAQHANLAPDVFARTPKTQFTFL
jgi:hypothetical protein